MTTATDRLAKRWELHHPALLSAAMFAVAIWKGPAVFAYAAEQHWHMDQVYTAVFTISTVVTAFLFTFYTFIITGERGFLAASRDTLYFRQTVSYTFRAIAVGAILSLVTIPMLVVQPVPKAGDLWLFVAALWAALSMWAGASFVRAAWLFAQFAGR